MFLPKWRTTPRHVNAGLGNIDRQIQLYEFSWHYHVLGRVRFGTMETCIQTSSLSFFVVVPLRTFFLSQNWGIPSALASQTCLKEIQDNTPDQGIPIALASQTCLEGYSEWNLRSRYPMRTCLPNLFVRITHTDMHVGTHACTQEETPTEQAPGTHTHQHSNNARWWGEW